MKHTKKTTVTIHCKKIDLDKTRPISVYELLEEQKLQKKNPKEGKHE